MPITKITQNAIIVPTGPSTSRPTSPVDGMLRKNTTTGYLEFWDPSTSTWIGIGEFSANGGEVTEFGGSLS